MERFGARYEIWTPTLSLENWCADR